MQIALLGSINLGARDGDTVTNLVTGIPVDTWVNIQVDVHNNIGTNDTYDIYTSFGGDTPALMASGLSFRNGTTNSLTTFFATQSPGAMNDRTACFDDIYYADAGGGPSVNPDIRAISVVGNSVILQWDSESGATYSILQKSSLTGAWSPVKTGIAGDGTSTSDSVPVSGDDQEFFRIEGN